MNVVVRAAPFQRTVAPDTNPVPFTVRVNAGPPAPALFGESDVRVAGAGGLVIVKVRALDAAALGFTTVTWLVPAAVISLAGIAAGSWALPMKVVVRAASFQRTVAPDTNPVPFTVRVNAGPPAPALFGERDVTADPGTTVTVAVPLTAPLVAVTVDGPPTVVAVNTPLELIVPPPDTDHVTVVGNVPPY